MRVAVCPARHTGMNSDMSSGTSTPTRSSTSSTPVRTGAWRRSSSATGRISRGPANPMDGAYRHGPGTEAIMCSSLTGLTIRRTLSANASSISCATMCQNCSGCEQENAHDGPCLQNYRDRRLLRKVDRGCDPNCGVARIRDAAESALVRGHADSWTDWRRWRAPLSGDLEGRLHPGEMTAIRLPYDAPLFPFGRRSRIAQALKTSIPAICKMPLDNTLNNPGSGSVLVRRGLMSVLER